MVYINNVNYIGITMIYFDGKSIIVLVSIYVYVENFVIVLIKCKINTVLIIVRDKV